MLHKEKEDVTLSLLQPGSWTQPSMEGDRLPACTKLWWTCGCTCIELLISSSPSEPQDSPVAALLQTVYNSRRDLLSDAGSCCKEEWCLQSF